MRNPTTKKQVSVIARNNGLTKEQEEILYQDVKTIFRCDPNQWGNSYKVHRKFFLKTKTDRNAGVIQI